ncbi:MAG TPA: hypothetical protein VN931_03630 [Fibrobacteria bacterium]|nr:hypothetical protein [Fibrobacteria bacterium]
MSKTIVLIACSSTKLTTKAKAQNIYTGTAFKLSLVYAKRINPDAIYIISALHHLLELDNEISPYNVTLSNISRSKRNEKPDLIVLSLNEKMLWGKITIEQISKIADLENDKFIILAGKEYVKPISKYINNMIEPLSGLSQGHRLAKLKELAYG